MTRAKILEELTWPEAERVLTPETTVIIPLGAAAKEHGPHLKLNNDFRIAEYLKQEVAKRVDAVIAPTISYFFYPAFVEYPGSTTLSQETAQFLIMDICMSLSAFGPRRFYVINTGISTRKALLPAAEDLAAHGIILRFTDLEKLMSPVAHEVSEQEGGSHADEIETSMMLYIAPETVDMSKASKDFDKRGSGRLTRKPNSELVYSPTGVWGDPTLATVEKGSRVVQSLVDGIIREIEELTRTAVPTISSD